MNPFSGFLQPQNHRPLEGLATTQDLLRVIQGNKEMAQRKLENEQQNTRANSYLALQQGDQAHRFNAEDQKQVEGLLAEYQQAEDQGDAVRLSRAAQMLKRFGMDFSQKQAPPDLRALTGEQLLPNKQPLPLNPRDFTGSDPVDAMGHTANEPQNPIDQAIQTELKSREALRARNADTGSKAPDGEPTDGVVLDADQPGEFEARKAEYARLHPDEAQEAAPQPRRLATQVLPTVISKGGKQLYESTGPSGRWGSMVGGVFEPLMQHDDPRISEAAKSAQQLATKLVEVDGVEPKDAIKAGMDYLNNEANRATNLERTKLGTRPRWGGGGGTTPGKFQALGPKEDRAESIKIYITEARGAVGKLNDSDRLLAQAEALATSSDPALQRNAIDVLVQSRSGATVSDRERARYDQLDGVIAQAKNAVARWTGGPLDPQYVNKIKMVIAEQRRINAATREEVAADLEEAYAAQNEGKVDQPILERRRKALGKTIRRTGAGDPNADLDE